MGHTLRDHPQCQHKNSHKGGLHLVPFFLRISRNVFISLFHFTSLNFYLGDQLWNLPHLVRFVSLKSPPPAAHCPLLESGPLKTGQASCSGAAWHPPSPGPFHAVPGNRETQVKIKGMNAKKKKKKEERNSVLQAGALGRRKKKSWALRMLNWLNLLAVALKYACSGLDTAS